MRTVFMGTPDFGVPVLEALLSAGHEVGLVVTRPDRAKGRGKKIQMPPVKEAALKHGIRVLQPEKIKKSPETVRILREYRPHMIVVASYGQIIQKEVIDLPLFGCVNVHASLLPELRGASPIQGAILRGGEKTGVTIMQMDEGLDTGDILSRAEVAMDAMTAEELSCVLSEAGARLLMETLPKILKGEIVPIKQDESLATYAKMITKEDGHADFSRPPEDTERKIRAFEPWPGTFCLYYDKVMKIRGAFSLNKGTDAENGCITSVSDEGIDVACGGMLLRITEIQMPGKKKTVIKDFLRGNQIEKGTILR